MFLKKVTVCSYITGNTFELQLLSLSPGYSPLTMFMYFAFQPPGAKGKKKGQKSNQKKKQKSKNSNQRKNSKKSTVPYGNDLTSKLFQTMEKHKEVSFYR